MHQLDKYQGTHSPDLPDVIDAEFSVINPPEAYPQVRLVALKLLTIVPILASLSGGLFNFWSVTTGMLGALIYTLVIICLNVALDSTQLKPLAVPMAGIALSVVLIFAGA